MVKHTKGPWGTRANEKHPETLITDQADSLNVRVDNSQNPEGDVLLIRSAPEMLDLLREARDLWIHNSKPHPQSTSGKILELLSRFGQEPEPIYLGTAIDLIEK